MYKLFDFLEQNKYNRAYIFYGLFLYNEMRMFDKALEIFQKG